MTISTSALSGKACLVLGATGFIGWNLCRHLISQGVRVRAVWHRSISEEQRQYPGIEWYHGSYADRDFVTRAIDGQNIVFHLVSTSTPARFNTDPLADIVENLGPTLQLAQISATSGVSNLIYASSGGTVYGISQEKLLSESSRTNPISCYGVGKLAAEKYLEIFGRYLGLKSTILRISNPYGPYQIVTKGQGLISRLISCGLDNEVMSIWGDGSVVRDFIFIDDVVFALVSAASYQGPEHIFNVGAGIGASVSEVIKVVESETGLSINIDYEAGRAVDVPVNILNTSLIRAHLNWEPRVPLREGIRKTFDWNAKQRGLLNLA